MTEQQISLQDVILEARGGDVWAQVDSQSAPDPAYNPVTAFPEPDKANETHEETVTEPAEDDSTNTLVALDTPKEVSTRTADQIAEHINQLKQSFNQMAVYYAIQIGADLLEAKRVVPHGEWREYLSEKIDYSERTAQQLMQVAKEYGGQDPAFLNRLSYTAAVTMIGLPQNEREQVLDERGNASTRELREAVQKLKEEKAALQMSVDDLTREAEQARQEQAETLRSTAAYANDFDKRLEEALKNAQSEWEKTRQEDEKRLIETIRENAETMEALQRDLSAAIEARDAEKQLADEAKKARDDMENALRDQEAIQAKALSDEVKRVQEGQAQELKSYMDRLEKKDQEIIAAEEKIAEAQRRNQELMEELKRAQEQKTQAPAVPENYEQALAETKYKEACRELNQSCLRIREIITGMNAEYQGKYRKATEIAFHKMIEAILQ